MTASTLVSSVQCVGLHHHAERSHLATDLFELLKQNLGGHQFHSNEEMEMVVSVWVEMHEPFFTVM
jgi:hypothetical protein